MHKAVAGPTERHQILKHIVGKAPSVANVVQVDPAIGGSAPPTAPSVTLVNSATEGVWQPLVLGH